MNREFRIRLIQALLFLATFITTTIAGAEWTYGKSVYVEFTWQDFLSGMHFSVPFLLILTVHEFGHYFTARINRIDSSLPYYIPIPPFPLSIGTMGAIIRLRTKVPSMRINFDIGIAGPLAGFIMALIVLFYGFINLPPADYIFQIHPEYEQYGLNYAAHVYEPNEQILDVVIGKNLLFMFFEKFVADPERMPNPHEIMHYPYLFAGFLALIFTSLNLLPIGQLDGGHVLYGLVGYRWHRMIAASFFIAFMFYAGLGMVHPGQPVNDLMIYIPAYVLFLYLCFTGLALPWRDTLMYAVVVFALQFLLSWSFPHTQGYSGWLVFGFVLGRFIGVQHPPSEIEEPLDTNRQVLGWLALIIFIISFSPNPIELK
ncbi:MAG: site-2 protease family protein [Cyclobacteriaceae bacterium]|nr:site-2 protease family protein [Cyclobacteriaceae bacterium]